MQIPNSSRHVVKSAEPSLQCSGDGNPAFALTASYIHTNMKPNLPPLDSLQEADLFGRMKKGAKVCLHTGTFIYHYKASRHAGLRLRSADAEPMVTFWTRVDQSIA